MIGEGSGWCGAILGWLSGRESGKAQLVFCLAPMLLGAPAFAVRAAAHLAFEMHGARPATRSSIKARVLEFGLGCIPIWRKVRASSEERTRACRPGNRPEYQVCMRPSADTLRGGGGWGE
jgi:hypothetical protein